MNPVHFQVHLNAHTHLIHCPGWIFILVELANFCDKPSHAESQIFLGQILQFVLTQVCSNYWFITFKRAHMILPPLLAKSKNPTIFFLRQICKLLPGKIFNFNVLSCWLEMHIGHGRFLLSGCENSLVCHEFLVITPGTKMC